MSDEKKFFESMESDILNANIPEEEKSKLMKIVHTPKEKRLVYAENMNRDPKMWEHSDRKYQKGIIDKFGEVVSDIGSAIYNAGKAVVETVYNIGSSIVSSIGSFFGF